MTIDAGLQAIAQAYAGGPADTMPAEAGAEVSGAAQLAVAVGQLATEMTLERKRRAAFEQRMQHAIRETPLLSVSAASGAPATFTSADWVCKTGYEWFVQLATAKGLGSSDTVWVYKTSASAAGQFVDSEAKGLLTNAAPMWAPGRTALHLLPGDGLLVSGTTTATVTVNFEVIICEQWIVPDFLL